MLDLSYSQPSFYDDTPICFFETASGARINLTSLCKRGAQIRRNPFGGPEVIDPMQYSQEQPSYPN